MSNNQKTSIEEQIQSARETRRAFQREGEIPTPPEKDVPVSDAGIGGDHILAPVPDYTSDDIDPDS